MPSSVKLDNAFRQTQTTLTRSMANFDANAILRGAQLTIVGVLRALQNPAIFQYDHYRQAALAVCAGIAVRFLVAVPIWILRAMLWVTSLLFSFDAGAHEAILANLDFIANSVLNIPLFLMNMMRYITPTLDHVFMDSLQWVDNTYVKKHRSDNPSKLRAMYYPNLVMYSKGRYDEKRPPIEAAIGFLIRFGKKAGTSLAVYLLSYVPFVGPLVIPAASFFAFDKAVGSIPAVAVFTIGIVLPKKYLVIFLQSYFASRNLMRELLEPYFSRIRFSKDEKQRFFRDREGVLFGFAIGFYIFLRIPLVGVLIYGMAEASTAYLITKITDPPPPPISSDGFAASQVKWTNKHEFLTLPLNKLDHTNIDETEDSSLSKKMGPERAFGEKRYS